MHMLLDFHFFCLISDETGTVTTFEAQDVHVVPIHHQTMPTNCNLETQQATGRYLLKTVTNSA